MLNDDRPGQPDREPRDGVRWTVVGAEDRSGNERHETATATAGHWARLGEQKIIWSTAPQPSEPTPAPAARHGTSGAPLSLVTQVGRSFAQRHPTVPVILDHGRHLVVEGAERLWGTSADDWRVEPLPEDTTIVERPALTPDRAEPGIAEVVASLSRAAFSDDVDWLAAIPSRQSAGDGFAQAAEWAAARLQTLGYVVSRIPVSLPEGRGSSVIAERAGTGPLPRPVVVVSAHLDSVNLTGPVAPGADDNASGAAGLLELARVLADRSWRHDLRLILFGGEEQGLHGSRQYVDTLAPPQRGAIEAVLNMDMIASANGSTPVVMLEGAPLSQRQIHDLTTAAATYTRLCVETSLRPFASDHVPFIDAGIPAVLTIEGGDQANDRIHTERDLPGHLDPDLALQILTMNAAALATWLGGPP